jgi:hypothetical protein
MYEGNACTFRPGEKAGHPGWEIFGKKSGSRNKVFCGLYFTKLTINSIFTITFHCNGQ